MIGELIFRDGGWARYLALVLTALALLRMFAFVGNDPILGYANQYDMGRISACLDFWPADSDAPTAATPAAPIRWYQRIEVPGARCHPSSEVVLGGMFLALGNAGESDARIDLRRVGISKALILGAFILLFTWVLRRDGWALLVHGAIVLLVLTDPANLLYLNTLYAEFSALVGCYVALTSVGIAAFRRQLPWLLSFTFTVGLLVLLTSKMQHLLLPWLFLLMGGIALRMTAGFRRLLLPGTMLLVATVWQIQAAAKVAPELHQANTYNAAFLTVLSSVNDAEEVVDDWGLRPECIRLVGTSWFQPRGQDPKQMCPEALQVSRADMVATLVREPMALLRILSRSFYQSGSWSLGFLGHVEGESFGQTGREQSWLYLSYAGIPRVATYTGYLGVLLFPFIYLLVGILLRFKRNAAAITADACFAMLALLCVGIAATWLVALIGDGYSDLSKHLHLAFAMATTSWILVVVHVVLESRVAGQPRAAMAWALVGSTLTTIGLGTVLARQPVAIGTVDAPSPMVVRGQPSVLQGWVKDPFGVNQVEAHIDRTVYPARLVSLAEDVDRMFPLTRRYPGQRYEIGFTVPDAPGWFRINVLTTSEAGVTTKIDSIWLEAR